MCCSSNIFILTLKILGAGRDDHFATREKSGNQIGEGLADTGTRLDHQHLVGRF